MSKGYAVVTGASTGIGEATAQHLAGLGFNVFAGVRNDKDAESAKTNGKHAIRKKAPKR